MMKRLMGCLAVAVAVSATAGEQVIELKDWIGRGFPPDLVQYRANKGGWRSANLRLTAADGSVVPIQVTDGVGDDPAMVSFVTGLPPGGAATYTLRDDGRGEVPASAVTVTREKAALVLANGLLAVRVPAEGSERFKDGKPASALPSPILGFRSGSSGWLGGGRMLTDRAVSGYRVALIGKGPVFAEVRYEIDFTNGGMYRATVRVIDGVPVVQVREEFDAKELSGKDAWELNLTDGWQPDRVEIASTAGNGAVDTGKEAALTELGVTPDPIQPKWVLNPDSSWGPRSHLGLFSAGEREAHSNAYSMVGYIPLHKGDWRRMNGVEIHTPDSRRISLRFPMSVRHATWLKEVTSETSPFSCQEHEPGLPPTYGRRIWGLVLGKAPMECTVEGGRAVGPFYQARMLYGVVGLDRCKDFVLKWEQGRVDYPRVFLKADQVERYRQTLGGSPLGEALKQKFYLASGDEGLARKRADDLQRRLKGLAQFMVSSPTIGHHAMAANYQIAAAADDVLAWPGLPAEEREEIRSRLALVTYLYQEPDVISYGNGCHSGNPNMGVARAMSMNTFMALLPDHPMFPLWRRHMAGYTAYKSATQMAPGGGYFEYGGAYHMHGGARNMNSLPGLVSAGAENLDLLFGYWVPDWDYYMNLLTPFDPRWGARMIPGMANSPPSYTEHLLEASGVFAERAPELAANLKWAWRENGANDRGDVAFGVSGILERPWLMPKEPALTSRVFPGVGVIFRAHQGPDETYLLFRSGYNWSHWYVDQGHFVMSSRGAVLVPDQPYQYHWSTNKAVSMYNTIRFGHPENDALHGWPDGNILAHAFGPSVDYAWASMGYPDWYIDPGTAPEWAAGTSAPVATGSRRPLMEGLGHKQGAFEWNRQIMFIKSASAAGPNYFVVRDSMPGDGRLAGWLNLNLLGTREGVKVEGPRLAVDTEWPVKLDVVFARDKPLTPDVYEELQYVALGGWSGPSWWKHQETQPGVSRNWVLKDGTAFAGELKRGQNPGFMERHVFLRLASAPGEGHLWMLYPRAAGDAAATFERLADGAAKITTPDGVDYVFMAPDHLVFEGADVVFEGAAGSVRVGKDSVVLAMASGAGRVGYRGRVIQGRGPFEKTLPLAGWKAGTETLDAGTALPMEPRLTTHEPVADGVGKAVGDGVTEYLIDAGKPVVFTDGEVRAEARRACIQVRPDGVRFIVPENTYVKLAAGVTAVRGVGPFDLTFRSNGIAGTVAGATRTIVCTWPEAIVRPMYRMDGVRWYAGWCDDHSIGKGWPTPQFAMAFGVTDGPHRVEISEWIYPELPPVPARRALFE